METEKKPDIFNEDPELLKLERRRFSRKVNARRILVYVLAGMALLSCVITLALAANNPVARTSIITQIAVIVVMLSMNLLSHKKPFIFMLINTIICVFGAATFTITTVTTLVYNNGQAISLMSVFGAIIQWGISIYMIMGVIYARKYEKLIRLSTF